MPGTKTKEQQERHNAARRQKTLEKKQKKEYERKRKAAWRAKKKAEAMSNMNHNNANPLEAPRAGASSPGEKELVQAIWSGLKERRQDKLQAEEAKRQAEEARHRREQEAAENQHRRELERIQSQAKLTNDQEESKARQEESKARTELLKAQTEQVKTSTNKELQKTQQEPLVGFHLPPGAGFQSPVAHAAGFTGNQDQDRLVPRDSNKNSTENTPEGDKKQPAFPSDSTRGNATGIVPPAAAGFIGNQDSSPVPQDSNNNNTSTQNAMGMVNTPEGDKKQPAFPSDSTRGNATGIVLPAAAGFIGNQDSNNSTSSTQNAMGMVNTPEEDKKQSAFPSDLSPLSQNDGPPKNNPEASAKKAAKSINDMDYIHNLEPTLMPLYDPSVYLRVYPEKALASLPGNPKPNVIVYASTYCLFLNVAAYSQAKFLQKFSYLTIQNATTLRNGKYIIRQLLFVAHAYSIISKVDDGALKLANQYAFSEGNGFGKHKVNPIPIQNQVKSRLEKLLMEALPSREDTKYYLARPSSQAATSHATPSHAATSQAATSPDSQAAVCNGHAPKKTRASKTTKSSNKKAHPQSSGDADTEAAVCDGANKRRR